MRILPDIFLTAASIVPLWFCLRPVRRSAFALVRRGQPQTRRGPGRASRDGAPEIFGR